MPLVGASGAISGVLGFYFVLFPRNTVRMLAFLPPFLMQVFVIPARFVLGMYLLLDNLLPFLFAGEGGVAHGAHIGGFIAGAAAAWLVDRRSVDGRRPEVEVVRAPVERRGRARGARRRAVRRGRAALLRAAERADARCALAGEAVELAGLLRAQGHAEAALSLLRRVVRDSSRGRRARRGPRARRRDPARGPAPADRGLPVPADGARARRLAGDARLASAACSPSIDALQKRRVGRLHSPPDWS